jgi:hypothetical protein
VSLVVAFAVHSRWAAGILRVSGSRGGAYGYPWVPELGAFVVALARCSTYSLAQSGR